METTAVWQQHNNNCCCVPQYKAVTRSTLDTLANIAIVVSPVMLV